MKSLTRIAALALLAPLCTASTLLCLDLAVEVARRAPFEAIELVESHNRELTSAELKVLFEHIVASHGITWDDVGPKFRELLEISKRPAPMADLLEGIFSSLGHVIANPRHDLSSKLLLENAHLLIIQSDSLLHDGALLLSLIGLFKDDLVRILEVRHNSKYLRNSRLGASLLYFNYVNWTIHAAKGDESSFREFETTLFKTKDSFYNAVIQKDVSEAIIAARQYCGAMINPRFFWSAILERPNVYLSYLKDFARMQEEAVIAFTGNIMLNVQFKVAFNRINFDLLDMNEGYANWEDNVANAKIILEHKSLLAPSQISPANLARKLTKFDNSDVNPQILNLIATLEKRRQISNDEVASSDAHDYLSLIVRRLESN